LSKGKRDENPVVTRAFCDERFQRSMDMINALKKQIEDVKQTTIDKTEELKTEIKTIKTKREEEAEEKSHFWRNLLGTIVGGGIVALIGFALKAFLG